MNIKTNLTNKTWIKILLGSGAVILLILVSFALFLYQRNRIAKLESSLEAAQNEINTIKTLIQNDPTNDRISEIYKKLEEGENEIKIVKYQTEILEDQTGRNILVFLEHNKIHVEAKGTGVTKLSLEICRSVNLKHNITVLIPSGSYFHSSSQGRASMVSTSEGKVILTNNDECALLSIPAASTDINLRFPQSEDSLSVKPAPHGQEKLQTLMPVMEKETASLNEFQAALVKQAAVWILTKNLKYADLGVFDSFEHGTRKLFIAGKISAKETLTERLRSMDDTDPNRPNKFREDYLLRWTPAGRSVQVNLDSSDFDTYLQLVDALTGEVIESNDDGGEGSNSQLRFTVEFGKDYLIRVSSYGTGSTGSYTLKTSSSGFQRRLINEYEAALAMKILDRAGINIKTKAIWYDRYNIGQVLKNGELKEWIQRL